MNHQEDIFRRTKSCGFSIIQSKCVTLSLEQVADFFGKYYESPFFPIMVTDLAEKPICVACLEYVSRKSPDEQAALQRLQKVVLADFMDNIHFSENAREEMRFFFPNVQMEESTEKRYQIKYVNDFLQKNVHAVLIKALNDVAEESLNPNDCLVRLATKLFCSNLNRGQSKRSSKMIADINELVKIYERL